jgi:hypothetical protein
MTAVDLGIIIMSLMILIYLLIIIKMGLFTSKAKKEKRILHVTTKNKNAWISWQRHKCLYCDLVEEYHLIVTEDPKCKVDKVEVK